MAIGSKAGPAAKLSNQSSSEDMSWELFGKGRRQVCLLQIGGRCSGTSGWGLAMLPNTRQCTGQPPPQGVTGPQKVSRAEVGNPSFRQVSSLLGFLLGEQVSLDSFCLCIPRGWHVVLIAMALSSNYSVSGRTPYVLHIRKWKLTERFL